MRAYHRAWLITRAEQVINHAWSRKLNQDIIAPVAAPTAGAGSNGDAGPPQKRPLPCWDWLHAAAERSVADAQKAWAAAEARGAFASHGWSLPYPYQDVKRVCPATALRPALATEPGRDVCFVLCCYSCVFFLRFRT